MKTHRHKLLLLTVTALLASFASHTTAAPLRRPSSAAVKGKAAAARVTVRNLLVKVHAARHIDALPKIEHLSPEHYRDVKAATLFLLKTYSPSQHYFVTLGRSPMALAAFMENLDPTLSTTFPASDLRLVEKEGIPQHLAQAQPAYDAHFEKYLPADVVTGAKGQAIVLIDRSRRGSGKSLLFLKGVLENYLARKGSTVKVKAVGFSDGPLIAGVEYVNTGAFPNVFLYSQGHFDGDEWVGQIQGRRSPVQIDDKFFGKHRIGTNNVGEEFTNPIYGEFKDGLRELMQDDADLDAELGKITN